MTNRTDQYFARFGFCARQIHAPAPEGLSLIVVMPCFNEPNLVGALESLRRCDPPRATFEVIVVINCAEGTPISVVEQNRRTLEQARAWSAATGFPVHLIEACSLPPRHAGVGLARKIGMDEALRRFDDVGTLHRGIILCFDADCSCEPNYLRAVVEHFEAHRASPACSIYFEHPLDGEAITAYELHLRYYVQALRYAAFPHAYHTIGSSMAVRALPYMEQGGMNRRQAGEDFYFLHKLIPLGNFTELNTTTVFPSPRASNRVPFGTGRAISEWQGKLETYPIEAFDDLKLFLTAAPSFADDVSLDRLPESVRAYLAEEDFSGAIAEIRQHTGSAASFLKRFYRWFDGFRAMKFVHHARDRFYGEEDVAAAAGKLLERTGAKASSMNVRGLLEEYRKLERSNDGTDYRRE